jgi:hypothetical protein
LGDTRDGSKRLATWRTARQLAQENLEDARIVLEDALDDQARAQASAFERYAPVLREAQRSALVPVQAKLAEVLAACAQLHEIEALAGSYGLNSGGRSKSPIPVELSSQISGAVEHWISVLARALGDK